MMDNGKVWPKFRVEYPGTWIMAEALDEYQRKMSEHMSKTVEKLVAEENRILTELIEGRDISRFSIIEHPCSPLDLQEQCPWCDREVLLDGKPIYRYRIFLTLQGVASCPPSP